MSKNIDASFVELYNERQGEPFRHGKYGSYLFCIRVKTLSPITGYLTEADGHTVYFSPDSDMFYSSVVVNAEQKWCSCSKDIGAFDFSIRPCENTHFVKRATRFKQTFITAWHGEFYLSGNHQILNFLYNTGIGSKNSQGFGMFEVLSK